ncbi:MAG: hypothetical protein Q7J98_14040 [Kiritimatiellia bacterium]|nr:hypothetical protein [Kiritimatiellia bacterium]
MKFLLVIAMIIVVALAGCIRGHPKVNAVKPMEYTVMVQADRAWQNSHIPVKRGQVMQFKAEGQWNDHFASYGPEGNPDIHKKHFGVNAPANSLIMQIVCQTNNPTYLIGKQTNLVAERSGEIYFRKNYSLPVGMKGEIKVKFKVCSDADGDGISDYDEIHVYKTNPLHPDSDGNGFSDLEEITDLQKKKGDSR